MLQEGTKLLWCSGLGLEQAGVCAAELKRCGRAVLGGGVWRALCSLVTRTATVSFFKRFVKL